MAETAGDIINSIRYQIPDRTTGDNPALDGTAFTYTTLVQWINDASELIGLAAPVVIDWWGVQSIGGQDLYPIPSYILDMRKAWYDLKPLTIDSEGDDIFTTKVGGPSWWFGLHSTSAETNIWHVWPAPSRTGSVTTLSASIGATDTVIPVVDPSQFMTFGFATIENELIRYATVPQKFTPGAQVTQGALSQVLRGQGGTAPVAHQAGVAVVEDNIMFNCSRLPIRIVAVTDPVEIPKPLWALIELYVLAKVRATEQNDEMATQLRKEFFSLVEQLANKAQLSKSRQGLQVRVLPLARQLYAGRVYIP